LIVRLVKDRIPARFGFDPKTNIQVLSPMNRSLLGARNLNQALQTALNPSDGGPEVLRFGWTFRIGDRAIQTENDYNRDGDGRRVARLGHSDGDHETGGPRCFTRRDHRHWCGSLDRFCRTPGDLILRKLQGPEAVIAAVAEFGEDVQDIAAGEG
jgi:hypothetical protein